MITLQRRELAGMFLGAGIAASRRACANPAPPIKSLRFGISRNDCDIGTHELTFAQSGGELIVQIDVKMHLGLGPFTLFRYHHQGEERWRDGQFVSLSTKTDNDGDPLVVHAQRMGNRVRVEATRLPPQDLPGTALPLTHWNIACMHSQLFNPQDGTVLLDVSQPRGTDMVALADGSRVEATHYTLTGKTAIDDWYDDSQIWTALRATVKDGSTLHYTRQA